MSAHPHEPIHSLGRNCLGALLALAVVLAALLSASPALHERLHSDAAHLCVVTLFAGGQCESVSTAPISVAPEPAPLLGPLPVSSFPVLASAHFFALLEHAPPGCA